MVIKWLICSLMVQHGYKMAYMQYKGSPWLSNGLYAVLRVHHGYQIAYM